jgi:RNA polymerase sigma-70 factor (ECF subfamily)
VTTVLPDGHFFRRESGRLVATLTRILGVQHLALVEDAVQETLASAVELWAFRGLPDNASAWLTTVARNRAISLLRRERTARRFAPEIGRLADEEMSGPEPQGHLPAALADDELRMIFSCSHPDISEDAQVALVLSLLCGFSAQEVAGAFLVSRAAMEKRLSRAKKVLSGTATLFDLGAREFDARLAAVLRALYLLFSEGYHGACPDAVVRLDLCQEAMRLVALLVEHTPAATPSTHALAALMCLHAARLPTRLDEAGDLTDLTRQDRTRWDAGLIARGLALLEASARGEVISEYHLEAGIAATHALAPSAEQTPWEEIVRLYDALLQIRPSPVIALNRAVALAEHAGPERGLEALRSIAGAERLSSYPFYPAALGELELRLGRVAEARKHLGAALRLARNSAERRFLERRLCACEAPPAAGLEGPDPART